MASLNCRLLPFARADGPANMAADEVLLQTAVRHGQASLRFYGWSAATVSLGYFQSCRCRLDDPLLALLPWVRRPSGGKTLIHHHELTYALALPGGSPWQGHESWLGRWHRIIAAALGQLGVAQLSLCAGQPCSGGPLLCFQQHTAGDLLCRQAKMVGSAQRRHRQCLLQHGAILLAGSPYAPALSGLRDLTGLALPLEEIQAAIIREMAKQTGWNLERSEWTTEERETVHQLAAHKYGHSGWNEKR